MPQSASRKPEIMSPAGYWPQLRAASRSRVRMPSISALSTFPRARKLASALEELPEVMTTLHGRGVRGYVTFNTLVFEHELDSAAADNRGSCASAGVDALIVQDYGIVRLAREIAPRSGTPRQHADEHHRCRSASSWRRVPDCSA